MPFAGQRLEGALTAAHGHDTRDAGRQGRLALALLLIAIAARMLSPAGFMPERMGDRLTLALCTGYSPMVMAAAPRGKASAHPHGASKDGAQIYQPCGFGGLGIAVGRGAVLAPLV